MNLTLNHDAIIELSNYPLAEDASVSSYWKEALSQFVYENDKVYGVNGAQGHAPNLNWFSNILNRLLLIPFEIIGRRFSHFTKILSKTKPIIKRREGCLDLGMLRQIITVAFLDDYLCLDQIEGPIVVIGDGWGALTSVLGTYLPDTKIVVVNLTQMLLIDILYISKSAPNETLALVHTLEEYKEALESKDIRFIAVMADDSGFLEQGPIGLAINIVSMQEMDPAVIADYFKSLRNSQGTQTLFYCCNRKEKSLPDGTNVRFNEYPWDSSDQVIIDELCPWHQFFLRARPPFINRYDGPIQHRLVALSKS